MADPPITRPSLLIRIRDARDAQAWQQFVKVYAPLVYGFLRRRGLQDSDAADLTQDVLRAVAGAAGRLDYDPNRGSFHGWLFTVVRHKLQNFTAGPQRRFQGTGDPEVQARLEQQAAPQPDEAGLWEQEYERQLLARAMDQVRAHFEESSWQAFSQTTLDGRKARDVAESLGMSVAAVYMAKSRVLAQLKNEIGKLREDD
jgi:RNA polymerase sigma-70 factor (ECF subfamily)